MVRGLARVYAETCQLVVPPEQKLLNLSVHTDKDVYQPGEKGMVHVEATDPAGKPVSGQVSLTAFDKAVTYIQPEAATPPVSVFYAMNFFNPPVVDSSFNQTFEAREASNTPDADLNRARKPEGWDDPWKIGVGMKDTPLLRFLRAGLNANIAAADRVVITGSNIPSSEEVGPPTLLDNPPVGKPPARPPAIDSSAKPAEPEIRTRFPDTALWLPTLKLDANGQADAAIEFPQSLTTWRLHGYAINAATQVGDTTAQATTTRRLIVRLLSPRFFTERDEIVLSAAVNNALADEHEVTAELIVPAALLQPIGGSTLSPDADGNLHLSATAHVAPGSEHRFDWPVKALRPGTATITARALTPQESDGVRLAFPVQVHGVAKTLVQSGSFRVGQDGDRTLRFDAPPEVDPSRTRLEINLSAGLAGVMIDALPYLADYPYGCVEQTMSRFYPSVLVRDSLQRLGTDLETLGNQRRQMSPADLAQRFGDSPVYDSARLDRMIREGLTALYDAQDASGGWGWWGGEEPSLFQTAYVLQGLHGAKNAGVHLDESEYKRGFVYLWRTVSAELAKPLKRQVLGNLQQQVYCAYVLSLEPLPDLEKFDPGTPADHTEGQRGRWLDRLYTDRAELNNQGRAMLALALHRAGRDEKARTVLRNLLQFVVRDDSNETAWVSTPADGSWFWWNNDIESNAWALKAIVALDPKNELAPRVVKWLLNNRRGGFYWRGTRDTAQVIAAMTDYLLASGEGAPDYELAVSVDGQEIRNVHLTRENRFAFDNAVTLEGLRLQPGTHEVLIHKRGAGALYYSARLTCFTSEEGVKGTGNEIGIERQYFKLVPKTPAQQATSTTDHGGGQADPNEGYVSVLIEDGGEVVSGDLLEVVLRIRAKNTCDYLAFEDPKPAGCEPVEVRSGGQWQEGFCANVELRDAKTIFYVELLEQGEHLLRYRLRAVTPGKFHVLPATGAAMYAPELRANSDEMRINVRD